MIRAKLWDGSFLMGIDAENVRRLREGELLEIDLTLTGGTDIVRIAYGDTLQDVMHQLEEATGQPLPPAMPMPDEGGPVQ